jgi:hypothetical protein
VPPACVALSPEPCPAAVGAFDRGKPIFSEKLTIHVHNAYLAVKGVRWEKWASQDERFIKNAKCIIDIVSLN